MLVKKKATARQLRQSGVSLLESLVAMVVLALGVLGLLGVQLRTMVDNQNSNYSVAAARLANDLFERIKANPNAKITLNPNFSVNDPLNATQWSWLANYVVAWGSTTTVTASCDTAFCTASQRATWDINKWKQAVASLPSGEAQVLRSTDDPREVIAIIGWRANEKGTSPVVISIPGVTPPTQCGTTHTCYFAYGQP
jgi:type IV pilus assembly protein PilV